MATPVVTAPPVRNGAWEPLPAIIYGFATHPLAPASVPRSQSKQLFLSIEGDEESYELPLNPFQVPIEVGDEVYAFERYVSPDPKLSAWYRGYVVSPSTYPTITPVSTETSELTGLPVSAQPLTAVVEDPQVSIGIFPASHIHARDELPDAEGRLANVYRRILSGHDPVHNALQRDRFATTMETLPEEEETMLGLHIHLDLDSLKTRGHKSKPSESGKSNTSDDQLPDADPANLKPPPPRPSLKSGDETFSGASQPLIDEIASALREWYTLMFVYLSRRDYALFNTVKDHIEALHLSRRQMLTQTLSADEAINLRKECVTRLVRGNIVQGLDVIVRHPAWGGLVTVDAEGDARSRSWVSVVRMYAMQAALAYIDVSPTDSTSLPRSSALGNVSELLTSAHTQQPAIAQAAITPAAASAKFFHVYLELKAFVASPCAPGETSELYFSLYNKADGRFLTEDFCAILNHNGVLARETSDSDKISLARTLFIELSHHDIQEPLYLVCKIVRKGAMKLGNAFGVKQTNNGRRGSEPAVHRDTASIRGWNDDFVPHQVNGDINPASLFRRPFACAVLELSQLAKMAADRTDTSAHEYTLPIFVPLEEATFSTLHQSIIASKIKEFEKSARAEMVAVMLKVYHGETSTIVRENPFLLQDASITSRLGFPDVVFPGDVRNEVYIKLWSGEFFSVGGSIRIRKSVVPLTNTTIGPSSIQVSIEVRTRSGNTIENAISQGAGEPPLTQFQSMVFYRNNNPTFGELVKLVLPADIMQQCHLFFTFRHRSSKDKTTSNKNGAESILDKPFAFAYMPLFPDGNAFLLDGSHRLVLYKTERIHGSITPAEYFDAPSVLPAGQKLETLAVPPHMLKTAVYTKDSITIRSLLCSTKFTQNAVLLGLLNWERLSSQSDIKGVLSKFTFVGEVEIVKFLRDIFDCLFAILVSVVNENSDLDDLVFNAFVRVLGIVQDRRFTNFQPVLDVYISKHFSCAAAASHLIHPMNRLISNRHGDGTSSSLLGAFKVWHYVFKFIIRARELQKAKEVGMGATSEHLDNAFKREIRVHLGEVNQLMSGTTPSAIIGTQTVALQQFTSILPDLADVFTTDELVGIATAFATAVQATKGKIVIRKLIMCLQLVQGFLFSRSESRTMLVEAVVGWIKPYFGRFDEFAYTVLGDAESVKDNARISWLENSRVCVTIVAVMLDKLQEILTDPATIAEPKQVRLELDSVDYILGLLPRLLETYRELRSPAAMKSIERTRSTVTLVASVPVVFPSSYPFSLLSASPPSSSTDTSTKPSLFNCALGEAATTIFSLILCAPRNMLINFLEVTVEIEGRDVMTRFLVSFFAAGTSILENEAYPSSWLNVNILAHKVLLKMIDPIAFILVRDYIPEQRHAHEFNPTLWHDGFYTLLKLLSSDQLVIEEFNSQKRRAVWKLAGDIRGEGASIMLRLWEAIGWPESADGKGGPLTRYGGYQVALITLVEQVLNLCLSHHDQLRTNAVQILYSMIVSEYHLSGHFNEIETELISKLDKLFMSDTKGDDISRAFFIGQLRGLFDSSSVDDHLRARVSDFLDSVDLFLELLLNVRELPDGVEFQDDRVIATLRLMNFIRRIGRDEIYIKYVHQLVNMHLHSQNYVEAALTLKLHSDLHPWNVSQYVDPLPDLGLPRQSHLARKETLCLLILDYLGKGKAWESALEISRELAFQHSEVTFNYQRLAEVLVHQASLLDHIVYDQRYYTDYFYVAFFGNFPAAIRGKAFVYRGFEWEKFGPFCERMLNKHPGAQLLKTMTGPPDEVRNGSGQFIQCIALVPEPDQTRPIFTNPDVPPAVRSYYEHCALNKFSYSRPYNKSNIPGSTEFRDIWVQKTYVTSGESFPTVLRRSEIMNVEVQDISPIENALNDIEQKTKELTILETKYSALAKAGETQFSTNALSMSLNGAVDAPVNGGITLYRQAFMHADFIARHPTQEGMVQKLRDAIDEQVRVVDRCLKLHGQFCPPEMIPFHETLEKFFRKNFYDEIQKLPVEGISDQLSLSGVKNPFSVSSFDAQALSTNLGHKRSNSSAARPSLSLPMPINVPGSTPLLVQNGFGLGQANSANAGPTRRPTQTLLQKNLAHLAQYGLTSLGSTGPERSTTTSDTRSDSPIESLVHVGPVMPSSSAPEGSMMDSVRSKFPRIGSIRSVLRSRSETH